MIISPSFHGHSPADTLTTFVNVLAHVYPSALRPETPSLSMKQQQKVDHINTLINDIKPTLGLERVSVNLIIDQNVNHNASMMGSSSALGGPVLSLGKEYFRYFNSSYSKTQSFREAQYLLQILPDHPLEMGKYLDNLPPQEAAMLIHRIHNQFSVLSTKELKGLLAHELGHAKQHHTLRTCGILATTLCMGVAALGMLENIVSKNAPELGLVAVIGSLFLIPTAFIATMRKYSRIHEHEADGECANKLDYMQGIQSFFKRLLIQELNNENLKKSPQKNASYHEKIKAKVDSWEYFTTHPHPAKRMLENYMNMTNPSKPSRYMAVSSMASTLMGTTFLCAQVAVEAFFCYYSYTRF